MDLVIFETQNGGDLSVQDMDLAVTDSFWPIIYTSLFGGNPGYPTKDGTDGAEQRGDWWGNAYLDDPNERMNSETENALNVTALNSSGRRALEQAVTNDLAHMSSYGSVSVTVTLEGPDKVGIYITITEPETLKEQKYRILWDGTRNGAILGLNADKAASAALSAWILANGAWDDLGNWFDNEYWKDSI